MWRNWRFFDRWFGIIPFDFPAFDPLLRFFFEREKTAELSIFLRRKETIPG